MAQVEQNELSAKIVDGSLGTVQIQSRGYTLRRLQSSLGDILAGQTACTEAVWSDENQVPIALGRCTNGTTRRVHYKMTATFKWRSFKAAEPR